VPDPTRWRDVTTSVLALCGTRPEVSYNRALTTTESPRRRTYPSTTNRAFMNRAS